MHARRLAELERALAACQRRLSAAGRILLDENLGGLLANWRTYVLVRDEEVKAIKLIESERAQLLADKSRWQRSCHPLSTSSHWLAVGRQFWTVLL